MDPYRWFLRAIVLLNVFSLTFSVLLVILAINPLIQHDSEIKILFGKDTEKEFSAYRWTVTTMGAMAVIFSGIGITLGTTPHKFFSIMYMIAAAIVMVTSLVGIMYEMEVMTDLATDKYNIRDIYHQEALKKISVLFRMHYIQKRFQCCGFAGPTKTFGLKKSSVFPYSCCGLDYPSRACKKDLVYKSGCRAQVKLTFLQDSLVVIPIFGYNIFAHLTCFIIVLYIVNNYNFMGVDGTIR